MKKKYWYEYFTYGCPVCGREKTDKIRRYTEKPKEWEKRFNQTDVYDWCNE
ncbi:MAG: hypothetical protein Q7K40_01250 [bacterium]|nr:hypothetical protein [bacterium]